MNNKPTYTEFVIKEIKNVPIGEPIYIVNIANALADHYGIVKSKASAAASVAMKRIVDGNKIKGLRAYKKGIYYIANETPFGETGIDKERLVFNQYLQNGNGYVGGLMILYQMGLTTQIPKNREIVTNAAKECLRKDERLGVNIRPPKTYIVADNIEYLRILDAIELMDRAPVDVAEPYYIMSKYIEDNALQYDKMLAIADKYYSKNTIYKLAHIASAGGNV